MKTDRNNLSPAARMAAELAGDPSVGDAVRHAAKKTSIVAALEDIRVRKGLRQRDVAQRMQVSDSSVSRFEDSSDEDVRIGDLLKYADAIGMKLTLFMEDPSLPAAEQIKHCVFLISDLLQQLAELSRKHYDDPAIVDGIARFRGEVLFNFFAQYLKSEDPVETIFTNKTHDAKSRRHAAAPVR